MSRSRDEGWRRDMYGGESQIFEEMTLPLLAKGKQAARAARRVAEKRGLVKVPLVKYGAR